MKEAGSGVNRVQVVLSGFSVGLEYLYLFPIIGITETWLMTHNADCFFMNGYSHEYDIRQNKAGGGVSFFIENRLIYTRRKYIQLNPIFNYIISDIEKSELNSSRNISVIIVYRPPNTDSSIFIRDMGAMRHSWMPKSLLKSIRHNHSLFKLSITNPTEINKLTYKTYNNKLNSIKRKAEQDYFSNHLEVNKSDIKKSWRRMKSVIGNKRMHQKSTFCNK